MRRPSSCGSGIGDRLQLGLGRQRAEDLVEQRAGVSASMSPTTAIFSLSRASTSARIGLEIVGADRRRRSRPCRRSAGHRDDSANAVAHQRLEAMSFGFVLSRRSGDSIWPRMRSTVRLLEARRGQREPQQSNASSWFSFRVRSEPPNGRARRVKPSSIALASSRSWKAARRGRRRPRRAGRHHVGDAGLAGRVLVGAAAEGEVHRDQRHRRLAHQPGFDAARADHPLDLGRSPARPRQRASSSDARRQAPVRRRRERNADRRRRHERFSSSLAVSLTR